MDKNDEIYIKIIIYILKKNVSLMDLEQNIS